MLLVSTTTMDSYLTEFKRKNRELCTKCTVDPSLLKKESKDFPAIVAKFQEQAKKNTQSLGNKETDHEVCFAALLEECGFQFLQKKKKGDHLKNLPTLGNGYYYIYQVNGSQQSLDFQTILVYDHAIVLTITYDLKHTTSDTFYLNDGWFLENIVYVITHQQAGATKTLIALGQSIPSEEEKVAYAKIAEAKKQLNSEKDKESSSLIVVYRFANRYKCTKFTEEWSAKGLGEVITYLT